MSDLLEQFFGWPHALSAQTIKILHEQNVSRFRSARFDHAEEFAQLGIWPFQVATMKTGTAKIVKLRVGEGVPVPPDPSIAFFYLPP